MEITYDPEANAAYIRLLGVDARIERTVEVEEDIFIDLAEGGSIVGIEILDARERLQLDELPGLRILKEPVKRIERPAAQV